MKKILVILLTTGLLLACNSGSDNANGTTTATETENHQELAVQVHGLELNNGAKWEADSSTLFNVAIMQNIISGARKESLENFHQTAKELQSALNKMVAECKMKGAEHDALHLWIESMMEKVKELNNETSTENAAANLSEIDKHLKLFAQYFEEQSS